MTTVPKLVLTGRMAGQKQGILQCVGATRRARRAPRPLRARRAHPPRSRPRRSLPARAAATCAALRTARASSSRATRSWRCVTLHRARGRAARRSPPPPPPLPRSPPPDPAPLRLSSALSPRCSLRAPLAAADAQREARLPLQVGARRVQRLRREPHGLHRGRGDAQQPCVGRDRVDAGLARASIARRRATSRVALATARGRVRARASAPC
jgi:hypothetical protein